MLCRLLPHAAVAILVIINYAAFRSPLYYGMCLMGMAFTNWLNVHKAILLFSRPAAAIRQQLTSSTGLVPADPAAGGKLRTD